MAFVNAKLEIEIPKLPKYLYLKNTEHDISRTIPISSVSDEDLKAIGICWTNSLIGKAQAIRKEKWMG